MASDLKLKLEITGPPNSAGCGRGLFLKETGESLCAKAVKVELIEGELMALVTVQLYAEVDVIGRFGTEDYRLISEDGTASRTRILDKEGNPVKNWMMPVEWKGDVHSRHAWLSFDLFDEELAR